MLEIKIIVEAPVLSEAINNLATAMKGGVSNVETLSVKPAEPVSAPPEKTDIPVSADIPENAKDVAPKVKEPVKPAPKAYTIDEIGNAGAALIEKGKMPELLNLLAKYEIQAIVQLQSAPAETVQAFAEDLKALGAEL